MVSPRNGDHLLTHSLAREGNARSGLRRVGEGVPDQREQRLRACNTPS